MNKIFLCIFLCMTFPLYAAETNTVKETPKKTQTESQKETSKEIVKETPKEIPQNDRLKITRTGKLTQENQLSAMSASATGSLNSSSITTQATSIHVEPTSGSASLPIHIDTPPGRAGIEPNINLVYSSGNRQLGLAGVGWNIDLGSINVSTKKGVPKYDSSDDYEMGGMKLIFDPTVGYYRPEIEGSFSKIEKQSNGWLVTDKKGTKYYYGSSNESRVFDPANASRIFKWHLCKVIDIFGNAMNLYYHKDGNQVYPDHIYYTALEGPNSSLVSSTTPATIIFEYGSARQKTTSYISGFEVSNTQTLYAINSIINQNYTEKAYRLFYTASNSTKRDLLTSIKISSPLINDYIPEIKFTYSDTTSSKGFALDANFNVSSMPALSYQRNGNWVDEGVRLGDLNGDGYQDFANSYYDLCSGLFSSNVGLNAKDKSFSITSSLWPLEGRVAFNVSCRGGNREIGQRLVDVDGDGYSDIIRSYYEGGPWQSALMNNRISDFVSNSEWIIPSGIYFAYWKSTDFSQPGGVVLGDVNADGFLDVVASSSYSGIHSVYLNKKGADISQKGWNTAASTSWVTPVDVDFVSGGTLVDLNGDGLSDLMNLKAGIARVWMNTGSSWQEKPTEYAGNLGFGDFADGSTQLTDVNGDGLPDIIVAKGTDSVSHVLINTGSSWRVDDVWVPHGITLAEQSTQFVDMNSDGMVDYINAPLGQQARLFTNLAEPIDILKSVDNGVGVTMSINYDSSTHFTNQFLPFPFPVVKSLTLSGTTGDQPFSYTTRYNYEGGLWDATDREFRGFKKVTTTDPDGNYAISYFLQDHFRKGTPYLTEGYDSTGKLLNKSENYVGLNPVVGSSVQFPYLVRSDNYLYGANGSLQQRSSQVMDYDFTTGNVIKKTQYGAIDLTTPSLSLIADPKVVTAIDNNVLTTTIDYINNATQSFMNLPKLTTIMDKLGNVIKKTWFYYDNSIDNNAAFTNGLLTKKEDWNGDANARLVTTYAYDVIGNLTSTTDPSGKTTTITYDSPYKTFPVQTTNALGQSVKSYYYGINSSELATDPKYNAAMWGPFGSVMAVVDANGQKVFKHYDSIGRLLKTISPFDTFDLPTSETSYTYGSNFLKIISKSRVTSGQATTIDSSTFVDGLGRVIQSKGTTATAGQYVVGEQKTYNSRGLVLSGFAPRFTSNDLNTMDPTPLDTQPKVTNYYDAQGRTIKTVSSDGTYSNVTYDGLKVISYDPNGHKNVSIADSFGRMVSREEYTGADGRDSRYPATVYTVYATTNYQYDSLGNLTRVIDAKGNVTSVAYDTLGRKNSMDDVDMHHWDYTYDVNGNLINQKDALAKQLSFTYDSLNRLKVKNKTTISGTTTVNTPLATYTYDDPLVANSVGRLTKVTYGTDSTKFAYDVLGRETTSIKCIYGVNYTVTRSYDDLNRLTKLIYPDATNVAYTYNAAGQAIGVKTLNTDGTTKATIISDVTYNAQGQMLTIAFGNGATTQYTYDPINFRLQRILTQNASAVKLQDLSYTYDSVGNILTITDAVNTGTQSFTYDDLNRLLTATGASYGTKTYSYDQIGNIILKDGLTYTYGANGAGPHAVTSTSDGISYRYDANGNMIGKTTTRGVWTYVYDNENRLTSVGYAPGLKIARTLAYYYYDGDGGRVRKIVYRYSDLDYSNQETYGVLVTQLGEPSYGTATYVTCQTIYVGNLYEIEGARKTNNIFLGSTRVAAITGTEIDFYHGDHLGSTNVISDNAGLARSLTEYDPFGKISRFEKFGTKINIGWQFFNGKQFDDETGLLYYGARYYDPKLGRFIIADTIVQAPSNPQTLNRYSYCGNNPVNRIDPSGHSWKKFWQKFGDFISPLGRAIVTGEWAHFGQQVLNIAAIVVGAMTGNPFLVASGALSFFNTGTSSFQDGGWKTAHQVMSIASIVLAAAGTMQSFNAGPSAELGSSSTTGQYVGTSNVGTELRPIVITSDRVKEYQVFKNGVNASKLFMGYQTINTAVAALTASVSTGAFVAASAFGMIPQARITGAIIGGINGSVGGAITGFNGAAMGGENVIWGAIKGAFVGGFAGGAFGATFPVLSMKAALLMGPIQSGIGQIAGNFMSGNAAFSHISYGALAGSAIGSGWGAGYEKIFGSLTKIDGVATGAIGGIAESEGDAIQHLFFERR